MGSITLNWETVKKWRVAIVSTVSATVSAAILLWNVAMWVDARYMYKSLSDNRWVDVQIMILESDVREYHRHIQSGNVPTDQERIDYEIARDRLMNLIDERNRLLGFGE